MLNIDEIQNGLVIDHIKAGTAIGLMDLLGIKECRTVSGACYSKLATNMREYVYENMWAGPPDYNGTYDVEEYVTGFIRTDKATISLNGSWAENINDPASTFIEFIGDKGGIKLTYGG